MSTAGGESMYENVLSKHDPIECQRSSSCRQTKPCSPRAHCHSRAGIPKHRHGGYSMYEAQYAGGGSVCIE